MSINKKCQVFTPYEYVQQLLDNVGYINNLYNKRIAENSCGDGNILVEIVKRYIDDCLICGLSKEDIRLGLERDIYAAEIDMTHIKICKVKLNSLIQEYGVRDVKWNIFHGDFLKQNIIGVFDFVVGNPPYITYKEISLENREFLRVSFSTCLHGKFDYCYAFIEASIKSLNTIGKLAYLVPSNIFKNQFADVLREFILERLTDIYDFTSEKLFEKKLTASSIIIYSADTKQSYLTYHDVVSDKRTKIEKRELSGKWQFISNALSNTEKVEIEKFGDYFHAASSIATLLNKVYIIHKHTDEGEYINFDGYMIEKSVLRNAISPRSKRFKKKEYIIFPYHYDEHGLVRYNINQFSELFPKTKIYLSKFQTQLAKRDNDNGIAWFEYGRSQAISHLNQPKLLLSTLVTNQVNIYKLGVEDVPTSGIYIVQKDIYSLDSAIKILESPEFFDYVNSIGVVSNASSLRIAPKDINNFKFATKYLK